MLVAGAVGALVWSRRRRRQREAAQLAEVRRVAEQDVTALSDAILLLEPEVAIAGDPRAPSAFADASGHFLQARELLARAQRPADLEPVTRELEEARYGVARTRAALEGQPEPERRPPCFFDPRHGPSTRDVTWAPPGGEPRPVPACEADALRVERHEEPEVRQLELAGGRRPYWEAPAYYGPWMGGWFGGFGGLGFLNGLMLGSLLSGPGWGYGGWGYGGGWGWWRRRRRRWWPGAATSAEASATSAAATSAVATSAAATSDAVAANPMPWRCVQPRMSTRTVLTSLAVALAAAALTACAERRRRVRRADGIPSTRPGRRRPTPWRATARRPRRSSSPAAGSPRWRDGCDAGRRDAGRT